MATMLAQKTLRFLVVLFMVTFFAAMLLSLVKGDPALIIAGKTAPKQVIQELNNEYGFNKPILERYWDWISSAAHGNLGVSFQNNESVTSQISSGITVTGEIAILATVVAVVIALFLALVTARHAGSWFDRVIGGIGSALISLPAFVFALLLVDLFAMKLGWFPVTGWQTWQQGAFGHLRDEVLPVLTVAVPEAVILQRVLRAELLDTLSQQYIGVAQAKGLSPTFIMWRHALKPSSFGVLTLSSLSLARLIGGTFIVENVFALPGLGLLVVQAVQAKDLELVQGVVAFIAVVYLAVNFLVDIAYSMLDPRIREQT